MDLTNKTAAVLGRRVLWPGVMVTLSENAGNYKLRVYGTGEVVVQEFLPDYQEQRYELRIAPDDVMWLLERCIAADILTVTPRPTSSFKYVPQISIFLASATGRSGGGHKRQDDEDERFDQLYKYLRVLDERARQGGPTYSGRANRFYEPTRGAVGRYWKMRGKIESFKFVQWADIPDWLMRNLPWRWIWFSFLIALWLTIAYFCVEIVPNYQYGFWGAIAHGFFVIQNGILSLFDGRVAWAPLNSGWWYNIGYALGMTLVPGFIKLVLEIIVEVLRRA